MNNNVKNLLDSRQLQKIQYYAGTTSVTLLVEDNTVIARGIAVCSYKDKFDIRKGSGLSYQRALAAYTDKKNGETIASKNTYDEVLKFKYIELLAHGYKYFSEYKPDDLPVEMQFLGKIPNFEYRLPDEAK